MPSDRAAVNQGPPCPHCGVNDWEPTPDVETEAVCRNCDYATDDPILSLPETCHACGKENTGDLYRRHEGQSGKDSVFFVCTNCKSGVRISKQPDIDIEV